VRSADVVRLLSSVATAALSLVAAHAQDYPTKPIRVLTSAPGGSSDFVARTIAQGISPTLGQQVIIENHTGATTGGDMVARAPADGYTLLYWGSTLWTLPLMRRVPYDTLGDFAPVSLTIVEPLVLVTHPSLPVKSVKELMALAKARPGELNYASGGSGSSNMLAAELFKSMAGVNIVAIPYKGTGGAVPALIAGEVQVMFTTSAAVTPLLNSHRVRALAVTTAERTALAPELPTIAEAGLPGYESAQQAGLLAPAKTSRAIVNRLNQEVVQLLRRADVRQRLLDHGVDIVASSPDAFGQKLRTEIARLDKLIKAANIRDEN
jgi:tripartite-type tricarboxylate transporter receptor subunit TctC